jgi:HAD superfamily hydrolase (TIGR01509 family)
MIRAFIFDFDGLIVDTEHPRYMGWKHIYSKYGCNLTPDDYSQCVGRGDGHFDFRADLAARANRLIDWITADRERQELRLSLLDREVDLPGVRDLVEEAVQRGINTAIASSSPRQWVQEQLQRVSMLDLFECIITVDDVTRAKPDPACYRKALETVGAENHEAVAFEDSPAGCRAALGAGIRTVVVTNRMTRNLEFPAVTLNLQSLAGVHVCDILKYFQPEVKMREVER